MSTSSRPSNPGFGAPTETVEGQPLSRSPDSGHHRVSLLFLSKGDARAVELADGESLIVGRSEPAELCLDDAKLSRKHAKFTRKGDLVSVEDLGSRNGTWLDGHRVESARLTSGASVLLGNCQATVHVASLFSAAVAGVESHDRWLSRLEEEIERARAFRRPLSVLMLRARGNQSSSTFGGWCAEVRQQLGALQVIGIYGPGALLVCAPETSSATALALAEGLRRAREPEGLTVGVATFPEHADSTQELISEVLQACLRGTVQQPIVSADATRSSTKAAEGAGTAGVYESPRMREVCELLKRLATRNLPVLLLGETGTGKELAARMLHDQSAQAKGPLRVVNCGAIPENLVESVLFGHERGAFTGADRAREGVFESAHGGSVFLDEVGELSSSAQAALLRALETRKITRVGGTQEIDIDARFIAATHRDLDAMASSGTFRLDLLHRLNAVVVNLPPLRERREDIAPLCRFFLEQASREWGGGEAELTPEALACLTAYDWPGNVRELRNVLTRAVALRETPQITAADLPDKVRENPPKAAARHTTIPPGAGDLRSHLRQVERDLILDALSRAQGNQRKAAELLNMPLRTFERRLAAVRDDGDGEP